MSYLIKYVYHTIIYMSMYIMVHKTHNVTSLVLFFSKRTTYLSCVKHSVKIEALYLFKVRTQISVINE